MVHGDAREGKWRGIWRMEWVASTLHTTSEHGVSSITTADAHTSAASSRLNWRPCRFKWTRPFRRKTKSGFCACAMTFQTQSTGTSLPPLWDFMVCSRVNFTSLPLFTTRIDLFVCILVTHCTRLAAAVHYVSASNWKLKKGGSPPRTAVIPSLYSLSVLTKRCTCRQGPLPYIFANYNWRITEVFAWNGWTKPRNTLGQSVSECTPKRGTLPKQVWSLPTWATSCYTISHHLITQNRPIILNQKHVKRINNGPTVQGISLFISVGPKAELNPEHFNHQVRTTTSWYNANYLCYNPRTKGTETARRNKINTGSEWGPKINPRPVRRPCYT